MLLLNLLLQSQDQTHFRTTFEEVWIGKDQSCARAPLFHGENDSDIKKRQERAARKKTQAFEHDDEYHNSNVRLFHLFPLSPLE
jgi:hypothetical protein